MYSEKRSSKSIQSLCLPTPASPPALSTPPLVLSQTSAPAPAFGAPFSSLVCNGGGPLRAPAPMRRPCAEARAARADAPQRDADPSTARQPATVDVVPFLAGDAVAPGVARLGAKHEQRARRQPEQERRAARCGGLQLHRDAVPQAERRDPAGPKAHQHRRHLQAAGIASCGAASTALSACGASPSSKAEWVSTCEAIPTPGVYSLTVTCTRPSAAASSAHGTERPSRTASSTGDIHGGSGGGRALLTVFVV
eukprot:scaffold107070_cov72-Phaeocystis_antarctica.AAC.1